MFIQDYHQVHFKFVQDYHHVHFISYSAQIKLPRPNLILDPRTSCNRCHGRFDCHYHDDGITVTITRRFVTGCNGYHTGYKYISLNGNEYILDSLSMRVYDPSIEDVPDFDSTIYRFFGLTNEFPPPDTTVVIIDPSVKTIKSCAFFYCIKMKKCIMHEGVETIKQEAFYGCESLEALFLPLSIRNIEYGAFFYCRNIRILSLPVNINISQLQRGIFRLRNHEGQNLEDVGNHFLYTNNDQAHQAIIDLHCTTPPMHRACLGLNVSVKTIRHCIIAHGAAAASMTDHHGMTPLHILSLNPHATLGSIQKCFNAEMSAAFVGDGSGKTPLDYLKEQNLDAHTWVVTSLCMHREAYPPSVGNNNGSIASREVKRKRFGLASCVDFFMKLPILWTASRRSVV